MIVIPIFLALLTIAYYWLATHYEPERPPSQGWGLTWTDERSAHE